MSTSHEDVKLIKYSSQKEDIFRRIKENIGLPGGSGRIGVRIMRHTRWTIKVDAVGSITSNCTVFRSTLDDAKDVDRARYGDEGKNSRHFVSNEQIPLPVRDHIGRTTAETRQQLQLKSAAYVVSATSGARGIGFGDAQWNPGNEQVDLFWTKVTSKAGAVDVGEPALPRRRKAPIRIDDICSAKETSRNNFDKEQIRVQLQLNANFDVVTVYGAMDIFHLNEYFLSLSQGQRSHFSSSFSSFLQRMLHRRDCSLCYDISKATCAPRRYRNV